LFLFYIIAANEVVVQSTSIPRVYDQARKIFEVIILPEKIF